MAVRAAASPTRTAAAAPPAGVADSFATSSRSSRTRRSKGSTALTRLKLTVEPPAKLLEELRVGLVALGLERLLQICDESRPELRVGLGAGHDLVETAARGRQLLRRLDPSPRGGRQGAQKPGDLLGVVRHRLPDA